MVKNRSDYRIFRFRENNVFKEVCLLSDHAGAEYRNTGK